jgi:hypothetical protein
VVKFLVSVRPRLWHGVRTIQKKGHNFFEYFFADVYGTVDALVCLDCGLADVLLSEDESLVSVDVPNRQSNAEKMSTLQNCVHGS